MLQVTALRAFADNYIWLIHSPRDARQVLVIDPGDAAPVKRALAADQLELAGILLTHHHADHVGGVTELAERFHPQIFGPAMEAVPGHPVKLHDGERVQLDALGLSFDVLDVPVIPQATSLMSATVPYFVATLCSVLAAVACSKAPRSKWRHRSPSWRHCPPTPSSIALMNTRSAT